MRYSLFQFIVVIFVLVSCKGFMGRDIDDKVIAQAAGKKLTFAELEMALPRNMDNIDSISFAQNYIEKWVKNTLLLEKAELNLNRETQKSIDIMIDNYRTSLMLYKYQQIILQQKLDTIVNDNLVNEYYENHSGNFKLDSSVVKSVYVKVPKSVYDRYKVRSWLRSNREEDLISLEDYCYQHARNFNMGEQWQYFGTLLSELPKKINNQEQFLRTNKYIETSDSLYSYYVAIKEYKLKNDTTPLVFVRDKIKDILINHRKVTLINDLENNIYNDAVDQKKFIIYTN